MEYFHPCAIIFSSKDESCLDVPNGKKRGIGSTKHEQYRENNLTGRLEQISLSAV